MRIQALGRKDPLEECMATHSSILAWRIPTDRGAWQATVHGVTQTDCSSPTHSSVPLLVNMQAQRTTWGHRYRTTQPRLSGICLQGTMIILGKGKFYVGGGPGAHRGCPLSPFLSSMQAPRD